MAYLCLGNVSTPFVDLLDRTEAVSEPLRELLQWRLRASRLQQSISIVLAAARCVYTIPPCEGCRSSSDDDESETSSSSLSPLVSESSDSSSTADSRPAPPPPISTRLYVPGADISAVETVHGLRVYNSAIAILVEARGKSQSIPRRHRRSNLYKIVHLARSSAAMRLDGSSTSSGRRASHDGWGLSAGAPV
jgi:hypothetical protein